MNILLVEDDLDSRLYLGQFLRKLGHRIVESEDGEDALSKFPTGQFNLVISDIRMPKISGLELLQTIVHLPAGRDTDIILFTGHVDVSLAIEALRAGAYDYLLKPINVNELTAVIQRVSERQSLLRENKIANNKFKKEKAASQATQRELELLKTSYVREIKREEVFIFSKKMKQIYTQAENFQLDTSLPILIQGETGTGKEILAKYIHYYHSKNERPFIDINCAAMTSGIFESDLFGYEAGAFTGGLPKGQKGKLDIAQGGTVFFDEIGELSVDLQAKLLRFIEEREFYRVGGLKKIKSNVRIICATNVDIPKQIQQGLFRSDLYYRLNIGHFIIPPLRERPEEILPMANIFLNRLARRRGKRFKNISKKAAKLLITYHWPGNVRELKNAIEWITFTHDDSEVRTEHLDRIIRSASKPAETNNNHSLSGEIAEFKLPRDFFDIETFYNEVVRQALEMHKGNKAKTASYLRMSRHSLYSCLKRMEVDK
ncbi:two component, sigma54 specific, transcriptional regulator, Fis family [Desulfofarcimen acetoxidans DSM 771]|uniref:Stage 0 sporulation protein A homolog n=1 Tax=Desulfofarcimen acetoxidans (strain ATCC 49208 / DSM 771 / KCTC 5769 / VKM B-1644 / 5575) TaxID=485916 RepID=C8VVE2_DESAS|nr:sigma-54 dependent transcriptional regulator [Desulfofarcimen acetoxidans]ACV61012.1 two component, sigma54 specific, transcriptional regulator, Fis family [Desulfofarcimen acetoxidans DSM 771]